MTCQKEFLPDGGDSPSLHICFKKKMDRPRGSKAGYPEHRTRWKMMTITGNQR